MPHHRNQEPFDENKHTPREDFLWDDYDPAESFLDSSSPKDLASRDPQALYRLYLLHSSNRCKTEQKLSLEEFTTQIAEIIHLSQEAATQKGGLSLERHERLALLLDSCGLPVILWDKPHEYDEYLAKFKKSGCKDQLTQEEFMRLLEKYEQLKSGAEKNGFTPILRLRMEEIIEKCMLGKR